MDGSKICSNEPWLKMVQSAPIGGNYALFPKPLRTSFERRFYFFFIYDCQVILILTKQVFDKVVVIKKHIFMERLLQKLKKFNFDKMNNIYITY